MWQAGRWLCCCCIFSSLSFSNLIMPANSKFGFSILVGARELAEYTHPADSTRGLVESILVSPVTYWLNVREYSSYSEEMEEQKWPVTPYQILVCFLLLFVKLLILLQISSKAGCPFSVFKVFVDGVKVNEVWLKDRETK